MSKEKTIVVGIGELLWDKLPEGKQLGGAPYNFSYHAMQMGCESLVVSALGNDEFGVEIRDKLKELKLKDKYVQVVKSYPTGMVTVQLSENGLPNYNIHENAAWDHIGWEDSLQKLAGEADALCFGSLAQRCETSRMTIFKFLQATRKDCLRVFDINLRQNYYSKEIIHDSFIHANIVKLNNEELEIIADFFNYSGTPEQLLKKLIDDFDLRLIAYTSGSEGSLLVSASERSFCGVPEIEVADTVGAGDSFTGVLIAGLLQNKSLKTIHHMATKIAAFVCTQNGATPSLPENMLVY